MKIQRAIFFFFAEGKINANAQQTQGNYDVNSGSSGGLIRLEAEDVGS